MATREEGATAEKAVKCIVLDAGPLIANEPGISSLLARSEQLVSPRSVVAEIRDPGARARVETTVLPFLTVRDPSPASLKVVSDFARRTGDLAVLSAADRDVIALAYELECERNGGDWRLRKTPGQKTLNGSPPEKEADKDIEGFANKGDSVEGPNEESTTTNSGDTQIDASTITETDDKELSGSVSKSTEAIAESMDSLNISNHVTDANECGPHISDPETRNQEEPPPSDASDDSDGEWITPNNLSSHVAADNGTLNGSSSSPSSKKAAKKAAPILQVATITGDFAVQNVLLQMNLNLLSSGLSQIKQARSHVLRCHACFAVCKDLSRQFCARCGQPALSRVACSVRADGTGLVLHLAKNYNRSARGDRYSIPKPVAGSASGKKVKGGGKGGWGNKLILAEDQKEYVRAVRENGGGRSGKGGGLMDDDFLPSILTGKREAGPGGRPKIGAGRDVNSRKR